MICAKCGPEIKPGEHAFSNDPDRLPYSHYPECPTGVEVTD